MLHNAKSSYTPCSTFLVVISLEKKVIIAVLILAIILIGAILFFVQPFKPAEEGIVLKIITRHGADIQDITEQNFLKSEVAKKYKIKDIVWLPVGAGLWIDTIKRSGDVDVGWGGGPVLFDILLENQLLAPLEGYDELEAVIAELPDDISGVPMKRKSEDGKVYWVAAAIASFGFTINKNFLNERNLPEPDEWLDLGSPAYAVTLPSPSVAVADATKSTSNTRMYEIILQKYGWVEGWKLITRIAANSRIYDQSGLVREAVVRGDVGVGITIDFYGYTSQLEAPGIAKYVLPKDGTLVNGDPIALLVTAKHPEAAKAFIAWILSPEGQKVWLHPSINRLPINIKVFDTPEGQERLDLKENYEKTLVASTIEFSDELALSYEYSLMWFFHATNVRAEQALKEAWMALTKKYLNGEISEEEFNRLVDELTNPLKLVFKDPDTGEEVTFTQEYAQKVNEKIMKDPAYRDSLVRAWREGAENRYRKVLEELGG